MGSPRHPRHHQRELAIGLGCSVCVGNVIVSIVQACVRRKRRWSVICSINVKQIGSLVHITKRCYSDKPERCNAENENRSQTLVEDVNGNGDWEPRCRSRSRVSRRRRGIRSGSHDNDTMTRVDETKERSWSSV